MRQGRGGQRNKKCCRGRGAPPITLPATLEDPAATWKGPPPGSEPQNFSQNSNQNFSGPPAGFQGPSPFQGPPAGAGSPAGAPPYSGGPPPGSGTPQYTASPAPSGSSTPGPGPPQSAGFPPPPNNGPPYNGPGPGPGPFGSPSAGAPGPGPGPQFVGRPGSSGPPFVGGPPGAGNPHFASPGQPFGGPQFGIPPGSPFGHGPGHPIPGPIPAHGMMPGQIPGPNPVDRIDQGLASRVNVGEVSAAVPGAIAQAGVSPCLHCDSLTQTYWYRSKSLPVPRRHTPYFGQPDYRIYELNKRLQQRTEESDNLWWDAFATEFFEDDATLTLTFCLEDGPKRYTIGRTLIPRYFRSIFEGGVTELYYNLKHPKESFHNTSITLDCDQCTMVTHHGKPMFTKVCTEGRLILEFTFDDLMRIKSWHFAVRTHRELVPRTVVGMHSQQDPGMLDQLSKNITRQGITNSTLNYLRLCVILEPMQELMSRHKAYALSPRDCLKTTLFQKWQRMVAPPESQRPANKRRKRKGSQSGGAANNAPPAPNKKRSPGPNFSLASQDVMVVGEPSLMGGEFGDEDERLITRLENTQYDAANSLDHDNHGFSDSPMTGGPNSWGGGGPVGGPGVGGPVADRGPGVPPQGNTPSSQDSDKKSPAVSQ
ncbi:LIM domain-binding protein 2 isoform X5 [Schistocerca americana]|uniref:LIM domain-binding protein 2 isoform X5 n=1 Tax=Schistocerca americana TaxID=7009 RepID=UPI001F4F7EAD|nr:LIM domain-binding protein 2 isoform X5 [Schistocerca americana]XP_047119575.1 LIM domain-binding protein 2 isoform X5 [Schistocerca piceifrons]XP_049763922.1 LIM domain-binding protein 2 isoform X5 [Schistocerca cancellata]XP_049788864.1 LIM domain-binding protein 2 isoform X5 [Schistocerca nitens]XP_049833544.1 LIM domain-binding protein 2 isoform X5 [Schistocerca gregaria]XP_049940561.1 LIM domain-binding protein 2 isoform X5 [Schistocerca serialis cubense]